MSLDGSVKRQRANERRSATQKQNAKRRERCDAGSNEKINVPVVKVLVPWHIDSDGCRARAVGCVEGNAPAG